MKEATLEMYDPALLEKIVHTIKEHRPNLGEEVADTTVAVIHQQLARQETDQTTTHQRRLVSILFVDVVSSTKTFEKLDPEDVLAVMDEALRVFGESVVRHGGMVARLFGDALLAFFGVPVAHENDPERAMRAALDIIEDAKRQNEKVTKQYDIPKFDVRVGINTGLVALGDVGGAGQEYTAMGDAINIAKHTESAAPHGKLLITHDTYRHVEGVFDVELGEKLQFKGREGLTQTYIVHRAKPRGFRAINRTIEGIEVPLIGRLEEMATLQEAYLQAIRTNKTDLVVISGNAGMGKSRLLAEFDVWVEALPENVFYLMCNGTQEAENNPHSLFHDMLTLLMDLHDIDTTEAVQAKAEKVLGEFLPVEKIHLLLEAMGFDFSHSPHVKEALGAEMAIQELGYRYLINFFEGTCHCDSAGDTLPDGERQATFLLIEDLHWADPASLELIQYLIQHTNHIPLFIVAVTRPVFFQKNPHWEQGLEGVIHLNLEPLTYDETVLLVRTMLQKIDPLPDALVDRFAKSSEGSPFYIEEIIKMMIEEEVIIKGEDHWWLDEAKVKNLKVPATLTGVLQARLDKLPASERIFLQRAAIIGQTFWDQAVGELAADNELKIGAPPEFLRSLQKHELIVHHPDTVFDGTGEYAFKSAIVREVVYETILRRQRSQYHVQIAEWLEKHSGNRHNEYVGLIAEHYVAAGKTDLAVKYLEEAAQLALKIGDGRSAVRHLERLLRLLPEDDTNPQRIAITLELAEAYIQAGNLLMAEKTLKEDEDLIHNLQDPAASSKLLSTLANIYINRGDYRQAHGYLEESIQHARQSGDPDVIGTALKWLGTVEQRHGDFAEAKQHYTEALTMFETLSDQLSQAEILRKMGIVARLEGKAHESKELLEQGLTLARAIPNLNMEADILQSLGELARSQKDYDTALGFYRQALEIAERQEDRELIAIIDLNTGHVLSALEQYSEAMQYYYGAMENAKILGIRPVKIHALAGMAGIKARTGEQAVALEWLGLVQNHPATDSRIRQTTEIILSDLNKALDHEVIETGLERGKTQVLEAIVKERLESKEIELQKLGLN